MIFLETLCFPLSVCVVQILLNSVIAFMFNLKQFSYFFILLCFFFLLQLHLVVGDDLDSPRPAQYKALVNANRATPSVLAAIEKRDLSARLSVQAVLKMPDKMHFTDGVDSKVQVSLSDDGKWKTIKDRHCFTFNFATFNFQFMKKLNVNQYYFNSVKIFHFFFLTLGEPTGNFNLVLL